MESLVTTNEAAKILNLSIQGIHYRIKKGQLRSLKRDGRVYVYLDTSKQETKEDNAIQNSQSSSIIQLKDEQIILLKKYIKWMKKQYNSEIRRLEKNQDKIVDVFNREINLLQQAFNEMRSIYRLEHKTEATNDFKMEFIDLKEFFKIMKKHKKDDIEIKKIIINAIKNGDKRFIFNKIKNELMIYKSDFLDLL